MRRDKGFTLMELMIVIAIIMILAGAIAVKIGSSTQSAKIAKATKECEEIATAVKAFYLDTGYWPTPIYYATGDDTGVLTSPITSGKNVLDERGDSLNPGGLEDFTWNGPYLETENWPKDPWEIRYYGIGISGRSLYVYSAGADKTWQSDDTAEQGKASGDDIIILVNIFGD